MRPSRSVPAKGSRSSGPGYAPFAVVRVSLGDGALLPAEAGAVTREKDFKRLVRARMSSSGERYTDVRATLLRGGEEVEMVPVTCEVKIAKLTEEQREQFAAKREEVIREQERDEDVGAVVADWTPPETQPLLLLKEIGGPRRLTVWCGSVEATAISWALQGVQTKRPMTHDLLRDVVSAMGEAREVRITEAQGSTFLAELLVVDRSGAECLVSCRPSDGIALALRANIPILVAETLPFDPSIAAESEDDEGS